MRGCLTLLTAIFTFQYVVDSVLSEIGNSPRSIELPTRTPGMTDQQYAAAISNAIGIPGAVFSFTGSTGTQVFGKVGKPINYASPWGSGRFQTPPPAGYLGPRPSLTPGSPNTVPPSDASQHPAQIGYLFSENNNSGGRRPFRFPSLTNLFSGGSGKPQPANTSPPVGNDYSNNRNRQGRKPGFNFNWKTNTPPRQDSPSTGYSTTSSPVSPQQPPPTTANYNFGGRKPRLNFNWKPKTPPRQDSSSTGYNYGGRRTNVDSKPSQPTAEAEDRNEERPVSPSVANRFGPRKGRVEDGGGGEQNQETAPQTTPVFDPKGGNEAAEKVAIAIVDGIRNVWNAQRSLLGGEKPLMDICEQAVANQLPAMKEMKRSDKTLLDVLPIWREKLTVELENFYQNEVRAKDVTRGSQKMHFMLLLYAECVRPKLVLMKV